MIDSVGFNRGTANDATCTGNAYMQLKLKSRSSILSLLISVNKVWPTAWQHSTEHVSVSSFG